jgi:hypothetical protein
LPPYRPAYRGRWKTNNGLPGYRPLFYTRPRVDPVVRSCHICNIGKRTGENPGGLPFALPAPIRSGSVCLPERRASRPDGGDLNAKHVDWNSRLITTRGRRLRDYANNHSCLIYGPETPATIPYNSSATPDVLDIVITKHLIFPVYLTTCSALSSDHIPVLIDRRLRSSFLYIPDHPDFRRTVWIKFQACLEDRLPSIPKLRSGVETDTCVEEVFSAITEALAASAPRRRPRDDPRPQYRQIFRIIYAGKFG